MDRDHSKKPFNKRAFVAIVIFLTGISLPVSGIMNHNLQPEPMTVDKHFWMSVHNFAAILFIIFVIVHIYYNWRVLMHYAKNATRMTISKEALAAVAFMILVIGLFTSHVFHIQ
jgi:cytochrome b subunit of formate dehydrogenase